MSLDRLRAWAGRTRGSAPLRRLRRLADDPQWGNLRRPAPLSDRYGFDRGTPVDRVYIEQFLSTHSSRIRGRVLEVKSPTYTRRYGGDAVTAADVVDVDAENPRATLVADLGEPGSLPAERYDCVVLTQTLQLIPDVPTVLVNAWSALRPGGSLLLTVPVAAQVEPRYSDLWRWTPDGLAQEIADALPDATAEVVAYGNLVAIIAFLHGIAAEELEEDELHRYDPRFPLVVAARIDR